MTAVGDDYYCQAAVTNIQQEHIRLFWRFRERDALPTITIRNYEIFNRVHQFRDRREDNERAIPLTGHPIERADVGSTDEKKIRGFKLKYNLLCENLRSYKIEQKDMADVTCLRFSK